MKRNITLLSLALTVLFIYSGCKKDKDETPQPTPAAPVADFTYVISDVPTRTLSFTNTSSNAHSYLWNFGDNTMSSDVSPQHAYASNGSYTVSLTAYGTGGSNTATKTINIQALILDTLCGFPEDSAPVFRKILLEEYTGHLLGYAPTASAIIYGPGGLQSVYGDTLIGIAVHASPSGAFTGPCPFVNSYPPSAPLGSYSTDYRTPAGETWFNDFNVTTNPKGMISRIDYPNSHVKDYPSWGSAIQSVVNTPAKARVQILNTYNSVSGNLDVCVKSSFLTSMSGTFYLNVLLTEDSITSWQRDYSIPPTTVPYGQNDSAYIHRNVLRGAINSDYGEMLVSGSVVSGDFVSKAYSVNLLSLPASVNPTNPGLNISRCSVVAFVYDYTTKEILQVEIEKVQ